MSHQWTALYWKTEQMKTIAHLQSIRKLKHPFNQEWLTDFFSCFKFNYQIFFPFVFDPSEKIARKKIAVMIRFTDVFFANIGAYDF